MFIRSNVCQTRFIIALDIGNLFLSADIRFGLILNTFSEAKNYKRKIEMCKFAYTTYEKILVDLRSYLRGLKINEVRFFNEIRLIDQIITDMCRSVSTRFELKPCAVCSLQFPQDLS